MTDQLTESKEIKQAAAESRDFADIISERWSPAVYQHKNPQKPGNEMPDTAADKLPRLLIEGEGVMVAPGMTPKEAAALLKEKLEKLVKEKMEEIGKKSHQGDGQLPPNKQADRNPGEHNSMQNDEQKPSKPVDAVPKTPASERHPIERPRPGLPIYRPKPEAEDEQGSGRHPMERPRPGIPSDFYKNR